MTSASVFFPHGFPPDLSCPDFSAQLKTSEFCGRVLRMSAAHSALCGSVADLDTVCCNMLSTKQLTNAAVVVSVMEAVEGGERLDGAELWMHSICLVSGSGRRMWSVYVC